MLNRKIYIFETLLILLVCSQMLHSQQKYWVYLTDKNNVSFNPHDYFDPLAIQRRIKNNIPLADSTDFPLNADYVNSITSIADSVCGYTRWFNALACILTNEQVSVLQTLPFVKSIEPMLSTPVYAYHNSLSNPDDEMAALPGDRMHEGQKSLLEGQITWMGGQLFKEKGITGKGIRICIIDAGFPGVNSATEFAHIRQESRIIKTWDFVKNEASVYKYNSHGSTVLSCIAGITKNDKPIGMAPDAEFLLARTERIAYEGKSEEEDWLMAVEWADRNGAAIINSSLGYTVSLYFKENMDGQTAIITKAANLAAKKGILVVNAAGNEGSSAWKFIAAPADADSVLTVGGINPWTGVHTSFSSFGPTADFRMKPNVSAFGHVMAYENRNGITETQGTSFASPLVVGFAACVMQLNPSLSNMEIFDLLQQSANLYPYFDYAHGFGIPQASFFIDSNRFETLEDSTISRVYIEPAKTFEVSVGKSTIEVTILDDFFQDNDNVIVDYHNKIRNFWRENDFFHLNDNFISTDSRIKNNSDNFLYYHFEDEFEQRLSTYYTIQAFQRNVLSIPVKPNVGQILRIHFKGYTYEMKVEKIEDEKEKKEGEGSEKEEEENTNPINE